MRLFGLSMLWSVALAFAVPAQAVTLTNRSSTGQNAAIVELAPLRGLIGQPAARGEGILTKNAAIGGGYESWSGESERDDFTDRYTSFHMEGLYYPLGLQTYPVFVGLGLKFEKAEIGRQEKRRTTTWARTTASERYDRWVNHDDYYSLVESLGYRLITGSVFTGSIRLVRDELLHQTSRDEADGILSNDPDLATNGRPKVRQQIVFHAGLLFH